MNIFLPPLMVVKANLLQITAFLTEVQLEEIMYVAKILCLDIYLIKPIDAYC